MAKGTKIAKTIVSVSRRTDIPAFYSDWFINRVRAGCCLVPNPMNPKQVSRIDLCPEAVYAFVFWTRNPKPLIRHLDELDSSGFERRYYFNYTVLNNPRQIDVNNSPLAARIETFQSLAQKIGAERMVWRYDPIVLSNLTPPSFHVEQFESIAEQLKGHTHRCVISVVDIYKKAKERFQALAEQGVTLPPDPTSDETFAQMMRQLATKAHQCGMSIQSCAEPIDLSSFGIAPGKCIDDTYLKEVLNVPLPELGKDKGQRDACGCVESREIGAYDTCLFGCQYCYATTSFEVANEHHKAHDPHSPMLFGSPTAEDLAWCEQITASLQSSKRPKLETKKLF